MREFKRQHRILAQSDQAAGQGVAVPGIEARDWGSSSSWPKSARDVIRQMQLSPGVDEGNPSGGNRGDRSAWTQGPDQGRPGRRLERLIEEGCRRGKNFICLWIDSPGGSPLESKRLADYLVGLPREQVRTVAYIPSEARADAAMVAMACDQIVMHPRAILGGPGQYQMKSDEEIFRNRLVLRDSWFISGPRHGRCGRPCRSHLDVFAAGGWATLSIQR